MQSWGSLAATSRRGAIGFALRAALVSVSLVNALAGAARGQPATQHSASLLSKAVYIAPFPAVGYIDLVMCLAAVIMMILVGLLLLVSLPGF